MWQGIEFIMYEILREFLGQFCVRLRTLKPKNLKKNLKTFSKT